MAHEPEGGVETAESGMAGDLGVMAIHRAVSVIMNRRYRHLFQIQ
jgi:hypothetical protein